MDISVTDPKKPEVAGQSPQEAFAQFLIYKNATYMGDSPLNKEQISIGSSRFADVILDSSAVADFHALVHLQKGQAFLTNNYPNDGLRLNGQAIKNAELQSRDVIQIGPFELHFKMGLDPTEHGLQRPDTVTAPVEDAAPATMVPKADQRFLLFLVDRYANDESRKNAAARMAKLFKIDPEKTLAILKQEKYALKHNLTNAEAEKWKEVLKNAGVLCVIEAESSAKITKQAVADQAPPVAMAPRQRPSEPEPTSKVQARWPMAEGDDVEEGEEDEWEAPFELSTLLSSDDRKVQGAKTGAYRMMVQKQIDTTTTDVRFLDKNQKYVDLGSEGRFTLAEYKSRDRAFVYFSQKTWGFLEEPGQAQKDLDALKTEDHLHNRRRGIYKYVLPSSAVLTLGFENFRYRIQLGREAVSPSVSVPQEPDTFTWRHWAASAGTHLVVLLCILAYGYFQAVAPKKTPLQFVKIDQQLVEQLTQPKKPEKVAPKVKPPEPKPEPKKVVPAKELAKETPKTRPLNTAKKSTGKQNTTAQVSKHPKAGGGFGEGNITNRNINQTGLLSVLGSSKVSGPSDVIASVTNLDAVKVPGATEKNFTVGGLKGSLGNGKIALASGAVVQTKGSKQVLRSAGASGKGEVAALERGSTGMKQVNGLVSAPMSRTVKIEGGMSQEMVKRVIDQHLDDITYCYETALINNPSIMGRIVLEWKILMSGQVGEIRIVASSVNSHDIHDCIKRAIKSWQFPKPVGTEVVVSYPFIFDLVAF